MVVQVPLDLVGIGGGAFPCHYELPDEQPAELRRDLWEALEIGLDPCLCEFQKVTRNKQRQQRTIFFALCLIVFLTSATELIGLTNDFVGVPILVAMILAIWRIWWVRSHLPAVYQAFEERLEVELEKISGRVGVTMTAVKPELVVDDDVEKQACTSSHGDHPELLIEIDVDAKHVPVEKVPDARQPLETELEQPLILSPQERARIAEALRKSSVQKVPLARQQPLDTELKQPLTPQERAEIAEDLRKSSILLPQGRKAMPPQANRDAMMSHTSSMVTAATASPRSCQSPSSGLSSGSDDAV
mmetsp:Transcript_31164/g.71146  ORF Transcript_31164/g.71146 Transcript_31164/m.71146 type:complete len:302 (-) Transcript_31164:335-1240(-)